VELSRFSWAVRVLLALAVTGLLPACRSREPAPEKAEAAPPAEPPAKGGEELIAAAEEESRLKSEYAQVMFERHLALARQLRDAASVREALTEVDHALRYRPDDAEAQHLRAELLRLAGERAGASETILEDQVEAARVQRAEQLVSARRELADGRRATEAGEYDRARHAFERAAFIVASGRLSPLGIDDELASVGAEADAGLREAERLAAHELAERQAQDTVEALRIVADAEERSLLEERARRARLLSAAIDHFNREDFEEAEHLAKQVLDEEPDNRVAHDVLMNARKGRHALLGSRYLQDLAEAYRRWQTDIDASKIPQAGILSWPSQSFWDRITRLRAARVDFSRGGRAFTPEEQALAGKLQTTRVDMSFKDVPFPQAVDYLTAASGLNLVIDGRAREDLDALTLSLGADRVTVAEALDLILLQAAPDGKIVFEIVGNVVRFLKKEDRKRDMVLHIHGVADLTMGLVDFLPPQITQVMPDEDSEIPLFGGEAEEAPQPYGTIEELVELVRNAVSPQTWEEGGTITPQRKNLVVYAPPAVQAQVARFLDDLRSFAHVVVTIEGEILRIGDAFLRDLGVDLRGLGGTSGPLAVLDDVTSGLVNNAASGFDNSGPGVGGGAAALPPSSGLYFSDGADGDFRARSENIFNDPLGGLLTALGGGTFQTTYLDDIGVSAIIRATEKSSRVRRMKAPTVTVYNTQRAYIMSVNQVSFIEDFDVEVAQTAFIADPVIGVLQEGILLDVRPVVSSDRMYVTLDIGTATMELNRPISTFTTNLGQALGSELPSGLPQSQPKEAPVTIQLPEYEVQTTESTARIPSGGHLLLSGLKSIRTVDQQATSPIFGNIPILGFLFSRKGKSEEVLHRMAIIRATVTDLDARE
jgi:tetratricopeptide (TPR) repeat protein